MVDIFGQVGNGELIAREGDKGEGSLFGLLLPSFLCDMPTQVWS